MNSIFLLRVKASFVRLMHDDDDDDARKIEQ